MRLSSNGHVTADIQEKILTKRKSGQCAVSVVGYHMSLTRTRSRVLLQWLLSLEQEASLQTVWKVCLQELCAKGEFKTNHGVEICEGSQTLQSLLQVACG